MQLKALVRLKPNSLANVTTFSRATRDENIKRGNHVESTTSTTNFKAV